MSRRAVASVRADASQRPKLGIDSIWSGVVKLQGGPGDVCTISEASTTRPLGGLAMRSKRTTSYRDCLRCGGNFRLTAKAQRYCGRACLKAAEQDRTAAGDPQPARTCRECGAEMPLSAHKTRLYCTDQCRVAKDQRTHGGMTPAYTFGLDIPNPTKGTLSELRVVVDLLSRGAHVFRSMSWSCPCDLVAWFPNGQISRIEVKTTWSSRDGSKTYRPDVDRNVFDIVACVVRDRIDYYPPLDDALFEAGAAS